MRWEKIYFQKLPREGESTSFPLMETISVWRLYGGDVPFIVGGEAKDLPSNDWGDEDGLEEWIPEEGIPLKSYDMEVSFFYKGDPSEGLKRISSFRDYLTGRDGNSTTMLIFSEHSLTGTEVRFVGMSPKPEYIRTNRGVVLKTTVTLKVVDPRIKVSYNKSSKKLTKI